MKRPIVIESFDCRQTRDGVWRVSARVDGSELWFESDLQLGVMPEAFLSCMLLPAMRAARDLECSEAVDETWLRNMRELQKIFHRWWDFPRIKIHAPIAEPSLPKSSKSALLFTAGVDSFHNLLRSGRSYDTLLNVEGLDVPIGDYAYRDWMREHLSSIADELGIPMLLVATNLRAHPLFKPLSYVQTHGSALASCGHIMQRHIGSLHISASSVLSYDVPFGSHWDTDPLWSSSRMQVHHTGTERWRAEKLVELVHEPIVRAKLRVCFNVRDVNRLNCGQCEKCVRTMLALHQQNLLENFPTLQPPASMAQSISRVSATKDVSLPVYEKYHAQERDPAVRQALQKLIHRNSGPLRRWKRSLHKRWWQIKGG